MIINYRYWARQVWEVTHRENVKCATKSNIDNIERELRKMISKYEKNKSKHLGNTMKFNSKQSQ